MESVGADGANRRRPKEGAAGGNDPKSQQTGASACHGGAIDARQPRTCLPGSVKGGCGAVPSRDRREQLPWAPVSVFPHSRRTDPVPRWPWSRCACAARRGLSTGTTAVFFRTLNCQQRHRSTSRFKQQGQGQHDLPSRDQEPSAWNCPLGRRRRDTGWLSTRAPHPHKANAFGAFAPSVCLLVTVGHAAHRATCSKHTTGPWKRTTVAT